MEGPELSAEQLARFKRDASEGTVQWTRRVVQCICEIIGEQAADASSIADVGGGDGRLLDGVLDALPGSSGLLVDLSPHMLEANRSHPRKTLRQGDLRRPETALPEGEQFDVILLNMILHHCLAESEAATRALQQRVLETVATRLRPGGCLLVQEQIHESPLLPELGSWLIYRLTRSRWIAPAMRGFGANTAGVGVLFASERRLRRLFVDAGLRLNQRRLVRLTRRRWNKLVVGVTHSPQVLFGLEPKA